MNCRLCRAQIEEFGSRERLSEQVRAHLQSCAPCETFYREQIALKQLIGELATVSAPHDFNFRLRARLNASRIGEATPSRFNQKLKTILSGGYRFAPSAFSIALAVCFALAVGAAVLSNRGRQKTIAHDVATNKVESAKTIENNVTGQTAQVFDMPASANSQTATGEVKSSQRIKHKDAPVIGKRRNVTNALMPSRRILDEQKVDAGNLSASTSASSLYLISTVAPRQLNQSSTFSAIGAPRVVQSKSIATDLQNLSSSAAEKINVPKDDAKTVDKSSQFNALGFEVAPIQISNNSNAKSGGILVTRIVSGGLAARGGLRTGDVIETINGQTASQSLSKFLTAKEQDNTPRVLSMRVRRDGKPLELTLALPAK